MVVSTAVNPNTYHDLSVPNVAAASTTAPYAPPDTYHDL